MALGPVTVVCVGDDLALDGGDLATDAEVQVVRVSADDAPFTMKEARVRGGVVAVSCERPLDSGASLLTLGADEVLSLDEATALSLTAAVRRARARAELRLDMRSDIEIADFVHDGDGLAMLAGAMVDHLNEQLADTIGRCDRLEALSYAAVRASEHDVSSTTGETTRTRTDGGAMRELVDEVGRELRAAAEVSQRLLALTGPSELGMCDLSKVALEVVSLVKRHLHRLSEITIEVPETLSVVPIGRGTAMRIISSLLRSAAGNIERAPGRHGHISVRLSVEDELVVLEVSDDGHPIDSEIRRQALESHTAAAGIGPHALSLILAAAQIRRAGGEILIDSQKDLGTSVRVFFPASSTPIRVQGGGDAGS
jgi:signal transduction histidine kinase